MDKIAKAKLKNSGHSAQKVRMVADMIRGKKVTSVSTSLDFVPNIAARKIQKCLNSAVANATVLGMDPSRLLISKVLIDEATPLKRFRVRSRRGMGQITKKSSHIYIELTEI